jgi:putative pyoverdin transport system ATP-binding/permease protein
MIKLIAYLLRTSGTIRFSRSLILAALAVGLLSGAGYAALIAILSSALSGRRGTENLWAFAILCLAILLTRLASQGLFDLIGLKTVFDVRLQLCRRILTTPLCKLEEVGSQRLVGALSDDVTAISTALTQLPRVLMNLAIILACLIYLGWLSWELLLVTLGFMAIGIVSYQILLTKANHFFRRLREQRDVQLAQLHALIHGAKELKLQRWRRLDLVRSGLIPTSEAIRRFTFSGNALFAGTASWGNLLFFIAVGLLVFGPGRRQGLEQQVVNGYALTLLYMLWPLETLFLSLSTLGRAAVAARKLDSLGLQLAASPEPMAGGPSPAVEWRSLDLVDVIYTYPGDDEDGEGFRIGPLRLSLRPGELVFLIGGNGSGKTSLAKVLTGLYAPTSGEILVDGRPVTEESRDDYRQMFSAVFADFHLFRGLIAREGQSDEAARGYFARLRLALLNACLEDRPVYFFDEWAADQDPELREVFYFKILPELRERGKAVIITSHDDRYYDVADRLIKLTDGRIEWERRRSRPSEAHA